jgi:hypothetical protein
MVVGQDVALDPENTKDIKNFGPEFTEENRNGNLSIKKPVREALQQAHRQHRGLGPLGPLLTQEATRRRTQPQAGMTTQGRSARAGSTSWRAGVPCPADGLRHGGSAA